MNEERNNVVENQLHETNIESKRIITLHRKQMEIARKSDISRDDVLHWLRNDDAAIKK